MFLRALISTDKHWLQGEVHYWCFTLALYLLVRGIRASFKRTFDSITHLSTLSYSPDGCSM